MCNLRACALQSIPGLFSTPTQNEKAWVRKEAILDDNKHPRIEVVDQKGAIEKKLQVLFKEIGYYSNTMNSHC